MIPLASSFWGVLATAVVGIGAFLLRLIISEIFHAVVGRLFRRPAEAVARVLPSTSDAAAETPGEQTIDDRLQALDALLQHGSIDAEQHAALRASVERER